MTTQFLTGVNKSSMRSPGDTDGERFTTDYVERFFKGVSEG